MLKRNLLQGKTSKNYDISVLQYSSLTIQRPRFHAFSLVHSRINRALLLPFLVDDYCYHGLPSTVFRRTNCKLVHISDHSTFNPHQITTRRPLVAKSVNIFPNPRPRVVIDLNVRYRHPPIPIQKIKRVKRLTSGLVLSINGKSLKTPTAPTTSSTTYFLFPAQNGFGNSGILHVFATFKFLLSVYAPPSSLAHGVPYGTGTDPFPQESRYASAAAWITVRETC